MASQRTSQKKNEVQLPDFSSIEDIQERKHAFFSFFSPLIETQNTLVAKRRKQLDALILSYEKKQHLNASQSALLEFLVKYYKVKSDLAVEEQLRILRLRVDTLPPSMVLAQAAIESAWGQSRFALEANNIFGEWCYREGCGLVPGARKKGATHEVRAFNTVNEALTAYFRNINTHRAYRNLRQARLNLRENEQQISGMLLIQELHSYSELGLAYVEELENIIRSNALE